MHCHSHNTNVKWRQMTKSPIVISPKDVRKKVSLNAVSGEFKKRRSFSFGGGDVEKICTSAFVQELNPPVSKSPTKGVLYRPPTMLSPIENICIPGNSEEDSFIPIAEPVYT